MLVLLEASNNKLNFFTCYLLSSQGEDCPPPPPVSWGHVTGLQTSLLGHLKGFMKSFDNPVQRESSLALIPAYLAYIHAYYHQLSKQVLLPDVHFIKSTQLEL